MSRLLKANFARLWKNKILWICMICMAGFAVYFVFEYDWKDTIYHMAEIYFRCNVLIVIIEAVFIGIFIGTDYNNGTIRNKIAAGHSRYEIFFANFLTSVAAAFMIYFVWLVILFALGGYQLFKENIEYFPVQRIIVFLVVSMTALIAQVAIYLFISMLIQKKAVGIAVLMTTAIVSLFAAQEIEERLHEPKYFAGTLIYTDDSGKSHKQYSAGKENPKYLTGAKRKIYESANRILPVCQLAVINNWNYYYHSGNFIENGQENPLEHTEYFPIYSICVLAVISGLGIFLFGRKDIK